MERSPGPGWGSSSPENGADSSSGSSSKEGKAKKGSEVARSEREERPAAQGFAKIFGREALQRPTEREVVVPLRAVADKGKSHETADQTTESTADQHKELSANEQEREVAAEVVDKAQARNEQEASQAHGTVGQAAAENVGQLLDNLEDGLESAPPEETAEHIIDRTTDETTEALTGEASPSAEMQPLDWPEFASEVQDTSPTETVDSNPAATYAETANATSWQQERFDRHAYDDEPDQTNAGASYAAPGGSQGAGGGRPPRGPAAGFNPNTMPPLGGATAAAANLTGWRVRAHETREALLHGFLLGALTGGIFGHWLGRRGERARSERAMSKQDRQHQEQVAKYESQVAESQARIRTLTEQQAYAARQAVRATEIAPTAARTAEQQRMSAPAEARRTEMRTEAPKRVERMTDTEVHEASRNLRIGDKTLYELKENGTIDATEERTLLRLAEQGGIEDPVRKYHFDQEARRVLMRHELDPLLAQQVLRHERGGSPPGQGQGDQESSLMSASPSGKYSSMNEPMSREPRSAADLAPLSSSQPTDRVPTSHPLVIANVIAVGILVGLLFVLLIISVTR